MTKKVKEETLYCTFAMLMNLPLRDFFYQKNLQDYIFKK